MIDNKIEENSERPLFENKIKKEKNEIKLTINNKNEDTKIKENNKRENSIKNNLEFSEKSTEKEKNSFLQTYKILINKKNENNIKELINPKIINDNEYNNQEMEFIEDNTFYQCYICENYFVYDFITLQIKCKHIFCVQCGKIFYEEKIEQGQFENFKCGIKNCSFYLPDSLLENLISKTHYEVISKKKGIKNNLINSQDNISSNSENLLLNKIVDFNSSIKSFFFQNKFQNILNYSLNNVFDINSNENFFQYSKNKNQICPKCKEMELYGKSSKPFIKCLNCLNKFCKYCFKPFEANHIEQDNKNRCKIYYRRKVQKVKEKTSFFMKFLQSILMMIGAYLIISTYFIVKTKKIIQNNHFSFFIFFKVIFYLILSLIFTPLSVLVIPYLTIISCI